MSKKSTLTQQRLKQLLHYEPVSGVFIWRVDIGNAVKAGDVAGYVKTIGYLAIKIDGVGYQAHRLAWLYMTGELPDIHIDHINRHKLDNRWVNLRAVSHAENLKNRKLNSNNKSGVTGVCRRGNRWVARITDAGIQYHLGYFKDFYAAVATRRMAEFQFGYHQNHGKPAHMVRCNELNNLLDAEGNKSSCQKSDNIDTRAEMALKLKPLLAERAKENLSTGGANH